MTESITPARTRFAPSPTGFLHLGSLRTAMFAWLYARHTGGQFILRIEDTDQKRFDPESLENMMAGMRWLGLDWDEGPDIGGPYGPYVQSERKELYNQYAQQLIDGGYAYRCYATAEELTQMREEQQARGQAPGYDRRHRYLTDEERAAFEAEGRPSVVRFAAPLEGTTVVRDLLRGDVEVESASVLDPVLVKSDGMPTYHLAVIVDDHFMKITHILRGQEWLPSAPLHMMLYDAFGWTPPVFVHMSVILDPSGKGKMSKRKKVVAGKEYLALVHEFEEAGYLPEALFNFLANVGWNFGDEREIFARDEVIERFELSQMTASPAALPYEKLEWLNGVYIRDMDPEELQERLIPFLSEELGIDAETLYTDPRLVGLVPLIQERLKLLKGAGEQIDWAFMSADQIRYDDPKALIGKKLDAAQTLDVFAAGIKLLETVEPFTSEALEAIFRETCVAMEMKPGSFFAPFRVAITGKTVSPPLFESMEVLGREETIARVRNGAAALQAYAIETA